MKKMKSRLFIICNKCGVKGKVKLSKPDFLKMPPPSFKCNKCGSERITIEQEIID